MTTAVEVRAFRTMFGGCPEHNAVAHWQWACLICPASRCYRDDPDLDNDTDVRRLAEGHVLAKHGAGALPRMRAHKGSVMHIVEQGPGGWLRSRCRLVSNSKPGRPRTEAYCDNWTSERGNYPDCQRCTAVAA